MQRRPALRTEAGSNASAWVNPHIGVVDEELEMLGCYGRSRGDADDSPLYMDRACANVTRSGGSAVPRCRSGLPFYRLPLQAGQTYLDCFAFCLSKGLDVCGIVTTDLVGRRTECRCGASAANAAVWHGRFPPPALLLDENYKLPQGDPECKVLVWKYKGGLVDSAVPFPLLKLSASDEFYIDAVSSGSDHVYQEDVPVGASAPMIDAMHANLSLAAMGRGAVLSRSGGYCKDYGVGTDPNTKVACSAYAAYCSALSESGDVVRASCPVTCGLCSNKGDWLSCYPKQCGPGAGPWPKASDGNVYINYFFEGLDQDQDQARKDAFLLAAAEWSSRTCIKFFESTSTPRLAISKADLQSCSSKVGFPGVGQTRTLNMGWCDSTEFVGTIMHEIGHVIGMTHEQNRPDAAQTYDTPAGQKGSYLHIYWNNIPELWRSQFAPEESSYIGSTSSGGYAAYDYGSIMHYPREAPGQSDPLKMGYSAGLWNSVVGQRNGLSHDDVRQTEDMYQCSKEVTCVDDPNYEDEYGDCDAWSRWVNSGDNKCESFLEHYPNLMTKCPEACKFADEPTYKDRYGDCADWSGWVESGDYQCESYKEDCPYLPIKCRTACGTC